jgi:hypothetical protein
MQTFRAKQAEVNAVEVFIGQDGKATTERAYVVSGVVMVEAAIFESLYEPVQISESAPKQKRVVKAVAKPAPKAEKPKQSYRAQAEERMTDIALQCKPVVAAPKPSITDAVRVVLAEGPATVLTLLEKAQKLGATVSSTQQIHTTCFELKRQGQIRKLDESGMWALAVKPESNGAHA